MPYQIIPPYPRQPPDPAIQQATYAVNAAAPQAAADPLRPIYHFLPPSNWMNDPNGTIYHDGFYHVFYQQNPFSPADGPKYWGHARSTDLVHWQHLPIALAPARELNETGCWSGCAAVNAAGVPMLFYTKVNLPAGEAESFEQWAALGDPDWLTWRKHPNNPILTLETHGEPGFDRYWRDPFIFREGGRTFMVIGACGVGTPLYEAVDGSLERWERRGMLCNLSTECPNFFKLDDRWVFLGSPFDNIHYYTGRFDLQNLKFIPQQDGILDYGDFNRSNLYASNVLFDAEGRCILFGWVRGFTKTSGWNGCLSLPRVLHISADGTPRQEPVPELRLLRRNHIYHGRLALESQPYLMLGSEGDAMEIRVSFICPPPGKFTLRLRCDSKGEGGVDLMGNTQAVTCSGVHIPLDSPAGRIDLHIFLDKSVMEVFVNEGTRTLTQVIELPSEQIGLAVLGEGGAMLDMMDVWTMASIW